MARSTALDGVEAVIDLVGAVQSDVDDWELVNVAKVETTLDDELFRLEACRNEPALLFI